MNVTKSTARSIRAALVAMASTCVATTIGFWPLATEADDTTAAMAEERSLAPNSARVGSIEAATRLVARADDPSKWYLEVRFVNRNAEEREVAQFTEQISENSVRSEMSRVASMPKPLWSSKEHVALGPGETSVVQHELPAAISARLSAAGGQKRTDGRVAMAIRKLLRTTVWGEVQRKAAPKNEQPPEQIARVGGQAQAVALRAQLDSSAAHGSVTEPTAGYAVAPVRSDPKLKASPQQPSSQQRSTVPKVRLSKTGAVSVSKPKVSNIGRPWQQDFVGL